MNESDREWVRALLVASEERMNARLAGIEADQKILITTLNVQREEARAFKSEITASNSSLKYTVVGSALALAALIIALFAFAAQLVDLVLNFFQAVMGTPA